MKKTRRKHSAAFKARVALAAAEVVGRYKIRANVIYKWKRQLLQTAEQAFESEAGNAVSAEREGGLLRKIGELTVDCR